MNAGYEIALKRGVGLSLAARRAVRLFLLDRITESWGIRAAPAGTCVWFELAPGATC